MFGRRSSGAAAALLRCDGPPPALPVLFSQINGCVYSGKGGGPSPRAGNETSERERHEGGRGFVCKNYVGESWSPKAVAPPPPQNAFSCFYEFPYSVLLYGEEANSLFCSGAK